MHTCQRRTCFAVSCTSSVLHNVILRWAVLWCAHVCVCVCVCVFRHWVGCGRTLKLTPRPVNKYSTKMARGAKASAVKAYDTVAGGRFWAGLCRRDHTHEQPPHTHTHTDDTQSCSSRRSHTYVLCRDTVPRVCHRFCARTHVCLYVHWGVKDCVPLTNMC